MEKEYLHGYDTLEQERLVDQANFLERSIFKNLDLSQSQKLLELGCGTGSQTKLLLDKYPQLQISAVDISKSQIKKARAVFSELPEYNPKVEFHCVDGAILPFEDNSFDTAYICWVLEHAYSPIELLKESHRVIAPSGMLVVTEVFNASLHLSPHCPAILEYWDLFNNAQIELGGDPNVGIKLNNLLLQCGFKEISVKPITHHYDRRNPEDRTNMWIYWENLLMSASQSLLSLNKLDQDLLDEVKKEFISLRGNDDSIFFYNAMQAIVIKS
jgi:ubiquinone/menaquinone biosynthesis C-methylase UbiE